MASATFTARSAAMRRTPRPPTLTPCCIVRDRAQTGLSWACSDGEPARSGGRHASDLGHRDDVAEFVADLRELNVTPHMAQNTTNRRSAIDGRTTRHPGYAVSGRVRKRIEEVFGWTKATAGFRKARHRGLARVGCCSPSPARPSISSGSASWQGPWRSHVRTLPKSAQRSAQRPQNLKN